MIKVNINLDVKDNIKGYRISGHANYDDYGKDIVCAAVSILGQNTYNALIRIGGIDKSNLLLKLNDNGYLKVELPNRLEEDVLYRTNIILKTFELGIVSLIKDYPEYIRLKYGRCN